MSNQSGNQMRGRLLGIALATGLSCSALTPAWAAPLQAASAPVPGSRVSGTVTAIAGSVLTVKDDKGVEFKVTVPDSARVLELPAGAKSLSAATPIKIADVAVGDRILAKTSPDGGNYVASTLIAMKQADIAKLQQRELQDWQARGVNGIVKSVDLADQTVTISTGNGPTAKTLVIEASKTTNIRRYAPDSTKFDDAKPATLDEIRPGDQLRAKGAKNDDGTELTADAIVAGTFRSIAGTVISVDASANKLIVNDLASKKPFTVDVNNDSQLHKLSPMMAQGIAMRLKGGAAGVGAPGAASGGGAPGQRGGDLQQTLNRAPVLQLADLKKGDAIMVLTTEGQTPGEATAVTLLAGVEPLLQASPSASQSVLSASWNLGGGAAAAGQDAQ